MDGASFDFDSIKRISRAVRRVEKMPQLVDDPPDTQPAYSIIVEVRITGGLGSGSGSGSGTSTSGSGSGSGCAIEAWPAVILQWNNDCGWIDREKIWVFELNGKEFNVGQMYVAKLLQHDYTSGGEKRPVGYAEISAGGPARTIRLVNSVCLVQGTPPTSGSGIGD